MEHDKWRWMVLGVALGVASIGCDGDVPGPEDASAGDAASVCTPGAVMCEGLSVRQVCRGDGTGYDLSSCAPEESCRDGACVEWICAPGEAACDDDDTRSWCRADGLGFETTDCATGESCVAGACIPRSCEPGEAACTSTDQRAVCLDDGTGSRAARGAVRLASATPERSSASTPARVARAPPMAWSGRARLARRAKPASPGLAFLTPARPARRCAVERAP